MGEDFDDEIQKIVGLMEQTIREFTPKKDSLNEQQKRVLQHTKLNLNSLRKYEKNELETALELNIEASKVLHPEKDVRLIYSILGIRAHILAKLNRIPDAFIAAFAAFKCTIILDNKEKLQNSLSQIHTLYQKLDPPDLLPMTPFPLHEYFNEGISTDVQWAYNFLFRAQITIESGIHDPLTDTYLTKALTTFQEEDFQEGVADIFRTIGYKNALQGVSDINMTPEQYIMQAVDIYKKLGLNRKLLFCKDLLDNMKSISTYPYSIRLVDFSLKEQL